MSSGLLAAAAGFAGGAAKGALTHDKRVKDEAAQARRDKALGMQAMALARFNNKAAAERDAANILSREGIVEKGIGAQVTADTVAYTRAQKDKPSGQFLDGKEQTYGQVEKLGPEEVSRLQTTEMYKDAQSKKASAAKVADKGMDHASKMALEAQKQENAIILKELDIKAKDLESDEAINAKATELLADPTKSMGLEALVPGWETLPFDQKHATLVSFLKTGKAPPKKSTGTKKSFADDIATNLARRKRKTALSDIKKEEGLIAEASKPSEQEIIKYSNLVKHNQ